MSELGDALDRLWATIESRKGCDPASSWTAKLLADPKLAAKKLGEEGLEAALAAATGDKAGLTAEAADVLYHLLAVLAASGVTPDEVAAVLKAREGTSGIAEKAGR
ncbi:MAG: phosphoribosyl-ATP diphosphatase [Caulobacter sp.]|jgi:phosphoribosyl-ATP pyrophosphohydrolase|nr:phosphoribosyl-ATP diphosphatase [Caulobacter sp.]